MKILKIDNEYVKYFYDEMSNFGKIDNLEIEKKLEKIVLYDGIDFLYDGKKDDNKFKKIDKYILEFIIWLRNEMENSKEWTKSIKERKRWINNIDTYLKNKLGDN